MIDEQQAARDAVAAAYGIQTRAGRTALLLALENLAMLDRKQRDYGPGNISAFGSLGVLVRASDKVERLKNLHKTGRTNEPENESVADSWRDLSNYGTIGLMCHLGLWPIVEGTAQDHD